jgi:Fe-S cluster assembly iron-binding protein IscA
MLAVTQEAATAIREMISSAPLPDGGGLRIVTARRDDGRTGLQLALVEGPGEADEVLDEEQARVFLEPEAAAALDDKVLDVDAQAGDGGVTFVIATQV